MVIHLCCADDLCVIRFCTAKGVKPWEFCLKIDGHELNFVSKTKYLGVFTESNKTDADVIRKLNTVIFWLEDLVNVW